MRWWVHVLDTAILVQAAAMLWVIVVGSFDVSVLGLRVTARSAAGLAERFAAIVVVRHLLVRRPTVVTTARGYWRSAVAFVAAHAPNLAAVLPVALGTRLAVLLVGCLAVTAVGLPEAPAFRVADNELHNLPARWDAGWYLQIATHGYSWNPRPTGQTNVAFFPAYPFLLRAIFLVTKADAAVLLWLGVLASIVLFLAALVYLVRLGHILGLDPDEASGAAVLLAAYPFAVFYSAPYSESLFLLAMLGACYHQHQRRPLLTSLWGVVAGLCRPNGALLCAPLALLALEDLRRWRRHPSDRREPLHTCIVRMLPLIAAAAAPAVGTLLYSGLNWWHTGRPFLWISVQQIGWGRRTDAFDKVMESLRRLARFGFLAYATYRPIDALQVGAGALTLLSIVPVARRVGAPYAALVALNVAVPLAFGGLLSIGRFTAVLFPMFLWLAAATSARGRTALACGFALLQGLCALLFFTWRALY